MDELDETLLKVQESLYQLDLEDLVNVCAYTLELDKEEHINN